MATRWRILDVLGLARVRLPGYDVVPPVVAPVLHRDIDAGAAKDDHALDGRRQLHGLVCRGLERDAGALPPGLVLGDERLRAGRTRGIFI